MARSVRRCPTAAAPPAPNWKAAATVGRESSALPALARAGLRRMMAKKMLRRWSRPGPPAGGSSARTPAPGLRCTHHNGDSSWRSNARRTRRPWCAPCSAGMPATFADGPRAAVKATPIISHRRNRSNKNRCEKRACSPEIAKVAECDTRAPRASAPQDRADAQARLYGDGAGRGCESRQ